jgi:hypothetical protein
MSQTARKPDWIEGRSASPAPEASTPVRRVKTVLNVRQSRPPYSGDILTVEEVELPNVAPALAPERTERIRVGDKDVIFDAEPFEAHHEYAWAQDTPRQQQEFSDLLFRGRIFLVPGTRIQLLTGHVIGGVWRNRGADVKVDVVRANDLTTGYRSSGEKTKRFAIELKDGMEPFSLAELDRLYPDPMAKFNSSLAKSYEPKPREWITCRTRVLLKPHSTDLPDGQERNMLQPGSVFRTHDRAWAEQEEDAGRLETLPAQTPPVETLAEKLQAAGKTKGSL